MYLRIIKKDLKRQKAMNIILLIFIILATTFIASSVNNLISISTALPNYFDKAKLGDYIFISLNKEGNDGAIEQFLNSNDKVESWTVDDNMYISGENIKLDNGNKLLLNSTGMFTSYNIQQQKFFDSMNKEISSMNEGEIYISRYVMDENALEPGDKLTLVYNGFELEFTIKDNHKDAFLGAPLMGTKRFIVNDKDFQKITDNIDSNFGGKLYSVNTYNLKEFKNDFNREGLNTLVACDKNIISTTYVMDMIIAAVLLIVSLCLIVISFVILRFTILFTIQEEYREIGVMKAIGIRDKRIRGLYILKYLAISIVGSMLGFFISIPFGDMFINKVSRNIIISDSIGGKFINVLCSIGVIIIVMLFCYSCTSRVSKFSPVIAIRNGSEGERYRRKGFLRLGKTRIPTVLYLSINNILSAPRRFGALVIIFTIGIILVIAPINTLNTLEDDGLVSMFNMAQSDVYMENDRVQVEFMSADGRSKIEDFIDDMETNLRENGINASVFCEMMFQYRITYQDYSFTSLGLQGTGVATDQYIYTQGQAPIYPNEVALTHITADEIGASIGDTVSIKTGSTSKDYIVTAIYQSINNMGVGIRFSEKENLDYKHATGCWAVQVRFLDDYKDEGELIDKIRRLYPDYDVKTGSEYIGEMLSDVTVMVEGTKQIIVGVIILINILVAILMVKTFIVKEKAEIGLLKSTGFRNSAIISWQILRIGIILLISMMLGIALANPITQLSSGKAFEIMGASHVEFVIKPLEVYVFYPLLILTLTMVASTLAALQVRGVSTRETHNIE
ncbi:MAG: ABC transporter permease [Clostridiales bacterium]|nr:ABC transporter permease [Clostridiales bacterium]